MSSNSDDERNPPTLAETPRVQEEAVQEMDEDDNISIFGRSYGLGDLKILPFRIRDIIHSFLLRCSDPVVIYPVLGGGDVRWSTVSGDGRSASAVKTLRALMLTSHTLGRQARAVFYGINNFSVTFSGHPYLPLFNRWMSQVGNNQILLRSVNIFGVAWNGLNHRMFWGFLLHLGHCIWLQRLTVKLRVEHIYAEILEEYISYTTSTSFNDAPPRASLGPWTDLIKRKRYLRHFQLILVPITHGRDQDPPILFITQSLYEERKAILAADLRTRLRQGVRDSHPEIMPSINVRWARNATID